MKKSLAWVGLFATVISPCATQSASPTPTRNAYYGDLHLHTSYSFDAYIMKAQVAPEAAYRFARGEPGKYLDDEVRRSTVPLDFLAVTDHAELIGVATTLDDPESALSRSEFGKALRRQDPKAFEEFYPRLSTGKPVPGVNTKAIAQSAWQREIEAANRYYQPGRFTTFVAYEWGGGRDGAHLHRNVIFRGDKAPNPFTALDSERPEDLWTFLEKIRHQGYDSLAIPHNPDFSNGLAFDWVDSDGKPIDQAYAERRAANEPLVEIVQNKGQSETRPSLSPNDEFANFEIMDRWEKLNTRPGGSYVRDALGRGLTLAQRAGGVNPFKYGFVGASDFHNGLSEAGENAYGGMLGAIDLARKIPDVATMFREPVESKEVNTIRTSSGNLTGVWAEENTREAIFAALRRKETFATSGTRLKLRFFGGWDFSDTLLERPDWVKTAYQAGTPMGGDLSARPAEKKAPVFAAWALKDPNGANLDRLQVVKVWLENGKHVETIYNVALSNGRKVDPKTGRAPAVGNTVDANKATYTNTIGATELATVWRDPQFDPNVAAVYYLRALEIPTPRWSTFIAVKRGLTVPKGIPAAIQERGWSSPVWYGSPAKID